MYWDVNKRFNLEQFFADITSNSRRDKCVFHDFGLRMSLL